MPKNRPHRYLRLSEEEEKLLRAATAVMDSSSLADAVEADDWECIAAAGVVLVVFYTKAVRVGPAKPRKTRRDAAFRVLRRRPAPSMINPFHDPDVFKRSFGMLPDAFDALLRRIGPVLVADHTSRASCKTPRLTMLAALHRLRHGAF